MRTQNKEKIKLAFKQVSDAERAHQKVSFNKLDLSTPAKSLFRKAITTSFNKKDHGFNFQRIFILNEDGTLKRCNTPYNPKDETLIDLICQAMTYIAKQKSDKVKFEKSQYRNVITDETLITMLKQRGYIIIKGDIV